MYFLKHNHENIDPNINRSNWKKMNTWMLNYIVHNIYRSNGEEINEKAKDHTAWDQILRSQLGLQIIIVDLKLYTRQREYNFECIGDLLWFCKSYCIELPLAPHNCLFYYSHLTKKSLSYDVWYFMIVKTMFNETKSETIKNVITKKNLDNFLKCMNSKNEHSFWDKESRIDCSNLSLTFKY